MITGTWGKGGCLLSSEPSLWVGRRWLQLGSEACRRKWGLGLVEGAARDVGHDSD